MAKPAATVLEDPAVEAQVPDKEMGPVFKAASGPMKWADESKPFGQGSVSFSKST